MKVEGNNLENLATQKVRIHPTDLLLYFSSYQNGYGVTQICRSSAEVWVFVDMFGCGGGL